MSDVDLALEGMHCDGCVRRVGAVLKKVPGVAEPLVEVGRVRFRAEAATVAAAIEALKQAGYAAAPRG